MTNSVEPEPVKASTGDRAGAYVIDLIPAVLVGVMFGWIPILGAIIAGFVLGFYWLFRDVTGASLGKLLLGLHVVRPDGQDAETGKRLLRNLPLCVGPFLLVIPLLGYGLAPIVAGGIGLIEIVLVLARRDRMGDRFAGTIVVRRARA